jgi:hypothetical protein
MTSPLRWRKTSHSDPTNCVELAWLSNAAALRDSKNPTGPSLRFPRPQLAGLITAIKCAAVKG